MADNGPFKLGDLLKQVVPLEVRPVNFEDWKSSIQDLAYVRSWNNTLLDITAGDWDGQPGDDAALIAQRKEAYCVMLFSIKQKLRYLIEGHRRGDANGIWKMLHKRFQPTTTSNTGAAISEFWNMSMEKQQVPVDKFIALIRRAAKALASMGKPVTPSDCTSVLLRGLLKDFHAIRTTLRKQDHNDFEAIQAEVIAYAEDNKLTTLVHGGRGPKHQLYYGEAKVNSMQDKPKVQKREVCRNFNRGACKWGDKCKRIHVKSGHKPTAVTKSSSSTSSKMSKAGAHDKLRCWICNLLGHFSRDCPQRPKVSAFLSAETDQSKSTEDITTRKTASFYDSDSDEVALAAIVVSKSVSAFLTRCQSNANSRWIFDSAATAHICNDIRLFVPASLNPCQASITIGDSRGMAANQFGEVQLTQKVKLKNVLYAPKCPFSLLSESLFDAAGCKLTKHNGRVEVSRGKRLIMTGQLENGLYFLSPKIALELTDSGRSLTDRGRNLTEIGRDLTEIRRDLTDSVSQSQPQLFVSQNSSNGRAHASNPIGPRFDSCRAHCEIARAHSEIDPKPESSTRKSVRIITRTSVNTCGQTKANLKAVRAQTQDGKDRSSPSSPPSSSRCRSSSTGRARPDVQVLVGVGSIPATDDVFKLEDDEAPTSAATPSPPPTSWSSSIGRAISDVHAEPGSIPGSGLGVFKHPSQQVEVRSPSSSPDSELALLTKTDLLQFHERYGHPSMSTCRKLLGLPSAGSNEDLRCHSCDLVKAQRQPLPKKSISRASEVLHRLFVDLSGKKSPSLERFRYFMLTVDDHSRKKFISLIRRKYESIDKFQQLVLRLENEKSPFKVAIVRSDGGGEFKSNEWETWCDGRGIKHEYSAPHRQSQNGVVERSMGVTWKCAQAMMAKASSPRYDWTHAVIYAVFLWNHLPTAANNGLTPNEVFDGVKRSFITDGVFGCLAYAMVYNRGKQEMTARRVVYLGHNEDYKAYKVRDLENPTRKVFFCRDVKFHNTIFPYQNALVPRPLPPPDSDEEGDDRPTLPLPALPDHHLHDVFPDQPQDDRLHSMPLHSDATTSDVLAENKETEGDESQPRRSARAPQPSAKALDNIVTGAEGGAALVNIKRKPTKNGDPSTRKQALASDQSAEWIAAEQREIASIYAHDVWDLVRRQPEMTVLGCRFVYKTKRKPDGEILKFKARLVAQGYRQTFGLDFFETFSATVRIDSVRIIIAIAAHHGWIIISIDIETFFLYGKIDATVYMEQPAGYEQLDAKKWVCRLKKSLYGTKQAPRCANKILVKALLEIGFKQLASDNEVFILRSAGDVFIMGIHVDDFICTASSDSIKKGVITKLRRHFKIKVEDEPTVFLSMQIERNKAEGWLRLHQTAYIEQMLERFGMADCKPCPTPMAEGAKLQDPKDVKPTADDAKIPYLNAIGSLIWLRLTRPDVGFIVGVLCRYMANYSASQWLLVKRVLRYLQGTKTLGFIYHSKKLKDDAASMSLECWADSDLAGRHFDSRSTAGYLVKLAGSTVIFRSTVERRVANSTCEAESYALRNACREVEWTRGLLRELGMLHHGPTTVFQDNQSTIKLSKNPVMHDRSKHYRIAQHYVRSLVTTEAIKLEYLPTKDMLADIFTKALPISTFSSLRNKVLA